MRRICRSDICFTGPQLRLRRGSYPYELKTTSVVVAFTSGYATFAQLAYLFGRVLGLRSRSCPSSIAAAFPQVIRHISGFCRVEAKDSSYMRIFRLISSRFPAWLLPSPLSPSGGRGQNPILLCFMAFHVEKRTCVSVLAKVNRALLCFAKNCPAEKTAFYLQFFRGCRVFGVFSEKKVFPNGSE